MFIIAGTIPSNIGKIITGYAKYEYGKILVGESNLTVNRGTAALVGASAILCQHLNIEQPYAILAGDIGENSSDSILYQKLQETMEKESVKVLVLHYLKPNIIYHKKLMETIQNLKSKPMLIADAGSMYVAKAAGQALLYDLFTPDLGELAFLADDKADHPAYTRGFICHLEEDILSLIKRAYDNKNAAKYLCIKGSTDYVCYMGEILSDISQPDVDVLEPIGGTGDTLTGIASTLIYQGTDIDKASIIAAKINRWAGKIANPTPATQIHQIIKHIPKAFDKNKEKIKQPY